MSDRRRWEVSVVVEVDGGEEAEFREVAQVVALQLRRGWEERFAGSRVVTVGVWGAGAEYSIDFDVPLLAEGVHEQTRRMSGRGRGTVRQWHRDDGWGVLDVAGLEGGCWAHFSAIQTAGYRAVDPGQSVEVEWERAAQDGYAYRAVAVWL